MRLARIASAAMVTLLAMAVGAPTALAHHPTDSVAHYTANGSDQYDFGTGASVSWLQTSFNTTASTYWPPGNDQAPLFSYNSTLSANYVKFVAADATGRPDECPVAGGWEACAAYDGATHNGHWDLIAFNNASEWCQETGFNSGCNDLPRAALHELGHIAGMARRLDGNTHNNSGEAWTVVQMGHAPTYGNTGWNTHQMQPCDVMGLALVYDVYTYAGLYPNCTDGIPNTLDGVLKTKITSAASTTFECVGTAVTLSGAATIGLDSTNYQKLSGNPLWGRDLDIQRKLSSSSTWSTIATVIVQSNASGSWSKTVSSAAGTWDYRVFYAGETGLHSGYSPVVAVTWSNPC